uniref:Uncharacterized protein n=1 Tax=Lactuca sativa TaxID=4236 RepID=A0A9R1UVA3_LACSA|nr:hypothetical protein LSAT_V11C800388720 [Lactuca sativa]
MPCFGFTHTRQSRQEILGVPNYKVTIIMSLFYFIILRVRKQEIMAETNGATEHGQMIALMQMVAVLLVSILFMLVLVVYNI